MRNTESCISAHSSTLLHVITFPWQLGRWQLLSMKEKNSAFSKVALAKWLEKGKWQVPLWAVFSVWL